MATKTKGQKLKILFVSTEAAPYVKVGGLADVCWALPRALKELGHDVRVMIPKYAIIDESKYKLSLHKKGLKIPTEAEPLVCNIKRGRISGNITVYLLENMEYYEKRANVYKYNDDPRRWSLLCRGAIEFLKGSRWKPDVIHTHDWMTGLLPNYLKTGYKDDPTLSAIATLFTIHNLNNQGNFNPWTVNEMDKDDGQKAIPDFYSEEILKINGMRRGIIYSDLITTVSENYSREILTAEYGATLDGLLRELRTKLFGVINGLDYKVFNPKTDSDIWVQYDETNLDLKVQNKLAFQKEFGLQVNPNIPMLGFVGRFTKQKGTSLFQETMKSLLENLDFQFVMVGGGSRETQKFFYDLIKEYPQKVGGHLMISRTIGQQIYAASDIFLYPSLFEPCGLAHLIAMRYGSIPVVRRTGGLADTVENYNPETGEGTGFVFEEFAPLPFSIQIIRALETYHHKEIWEKLQKRVMRLDFSWRASAKRYAGLYKKAIIKHNKWLKKEGLLTPEVPDEVPGEETIDALS